MKIESLQLKNFRNYESLELQFDPGTNIFYGDNAQGKTNILESIYMSGTSKSHKGSKDKDLIRFKEQEAHIRIVVRKREIPYQIDFHLKKNKTKGIAINGIPIKRARELFGILNVIFFSPEDLSLIKNGPSERRRFLDMELCQLDSYYVHNLFQYNRVLNQRNKLLKELLFRPELEDTLSVWDEQLFRYGKEMIRYRTAFTEQLNRISVEIHSSLTGEREILRIVYEPDTSEKCFESDLFRRREQDKKMRTTTCGPHRDDLSFLANGIDIRTFGSQGQQRTAALSLKLAEIELVRQRIHDAPVLLLDDVLSELDSSRQNYLLNNISNIQTFITCTGLDEFIQNRFHMNKVFCVDQGIVCDEN